MFHVADAASSQCSTYFDGEIFRYVTRAQSRVVGSRMDAIGREEIETAARGVFGMKIVVDLAPGPVHVIDGL